MKYRVKPLLMLPLLALDCFGNMVCGGSWRNTMSSESWNNRNTRFWARIKVIADGMFGAGHCERQAEVEAKYGSVWAAWLASIKEA